WRIARQEKRLGGPNGDRTRTPGCWRSRVTPNWPALPFEMCRRLSVDKELSFLWSIVTHDQHGLLNSSGVKAGAATHPYDIRIAGQAVVGVGFPAGRIDVDGGPGRIVAK